MEQYGSDIQERVSVTSDASTPYVPLERQDFPAIFQALKSADADTWNESLNKLNSFLENQNEFAVENLDVIDLPMLFEVASTTTDETLRSCLLEFVGTFSSLSSDALSKTIPFLPKLVALLATGNVLDLHLILSILEEISTQHPSTEEDILQELTTLYSPLTSMKSEADVEEPRMVALIETFENCLVFDRSTLIPIFTKASVVDAVLATCLCNYSKAHASLISCCSQMMEHLSEIDNNLPDETERGNTAAFIFGVFRHLVCDKDEEVAKAAASFIGEDRNELNGLMRIMFSDSLDAIKSLVLQIALKPLHTVGVPCEYALLRFIEGEEEDETKQAVKTVFAKLWSDEDVLVDTKLQVIRGLIDSFTDLRKIAIDNGLCDFVINIGCQKSDHDQTISALVNTIIIFLVVEPISHFVCIKTLLDKGMESEQYIGSVLIDMEGALQYFVDLLVENGPSDVRKLAGSILARTLDSYNDGVSRREAAAKFLTSSATRPKLLSLLDSDNVEIVNAGLHLLGEILSGEPGFSFRDEDEPEAPCPSKDIIVSKELVEKTVQLLKSPPIAVEALYLLSQFTWEYKRGFELLKTAFEAVVPTADVFFFQSLYGEYVNRHTGRQRRVIAEAAFKAGGLQRVFALLEQDYTTVEARRAAVESVRVLLAADSADVAVGRKSARLAHVVAVLLTDDTVESLKVARFMIRLLSYSFADADADSIDLDAWKGEITSETVQQLMKWAGKGPDVVDVHAEEEADDEDIIAKRQKASQDYEEVLSAVAEILKGLRSILTGFYSEIIPPIIQASVARDIFEPSDLLEFMRTFITKDDECMQPLVKAIQDVLSTSQTPEFDKYYSWISSDPTMCSAFYKAGIMDYILKAYDKEPEKKDSKEGQIGEEKEIEEIEEKRADGEGEDEENEDEDVDGGDDEDEIGHLPIKLLAHIAEHIDDADDLKHIQDAFIAHDKAVSHALRFARNRDSIYDAQEVTRNLYFLAKDNQTCIDVLAKSNLYDDLIDLIPNEEVSLGRIGLLIALLAHTAPTNKLTKALTPIMKGNGPHDRKDVMELMQTLFDGSSAGKEAVLNTKPVKFVKKCLNANEIDLREVALTLLGSLFVAGSPEASDFIRLISKQIREQKEPLPKALEVLRTVLSEERAAAVVQSGLIDPLFKIAVESPASVGDMDVLVRSFGDLASLDGCRSTVVSLIKDHIGSEDALEQESSWGISHLVRQWLWTGGSGISVFVEAGGFDYALKLMHADNLYHNVKGAVLVESLAYYDDLRDQVQPWLTERQIPALLLQIQAKCLEQSTLDVAVDAKEDETPGQFKERVNLAKRWYETLSTTVKIVNGEIIEGYSPTF
ncbi:hypothetical protein CVT24_011116 [Panaeolus cyanescens]|uniref:Uncharacterized protein n=1 Tax=Panaeolus cyanescens TaxID=181874 RepID=A0A409YG43_9AGAR|nr:hypothetical protein CVT24_011116 [Panaeolus cyanescens]